MTQRVQLLFADPAAAAPLRSLLRQWSVAHPDFGVERGTAVSEGQYHATASISGALSAAAPALKELRPVLKAWDAHVVAGSLHQVLPARQVALRVVFPVVRLAPFTRGAFLSYWIERHAEIPRSIPGMHSYAQLHADDALTASVADCTGAHVAGWDGCALVGHVDMPEFDRVMAHPLFAERAVADMATFVDHSRSSLNLFQLDPA